MIFKIRALISGTLYSGAYIGESTSRFFGRQHSGDAKDNFFLSSGTLLDMEFDATKQHPEPGQTLDCDGHFIDFSKKQVPEPVFIVSKINSAFILLLFVLISSCRFEPDYQCSAQDSVISAQRIYIDELKHSVSTRDSLLAKTRKEYMDFIIRSTKDIKRITNRVN